MNTSDLATKVDAVLIDNIPSGLKSAMVALLDKGASAEVIMATVRRCTGGISGPHGIVYLVCEAFLQAEMERRSAAA